MKKSNISIVVLITIIAAFGLSAFTPKPQTESQKWFRFTGNDNTMANSYTIAPNDGADPECDALPDVVCAIYATVDSNNKPVQSELDAIVSASDNFTDEVEGLLEYQEE